MQQFTELYPLAMIGEIARSLGVASSAQKCGAYVDQIVTFVAES